MSTRSMIFKENQDGTFTGIYCHFDGYPEHNGRILRNFYATEEQVDKLIALGDISSLDESPESPPEGHTFGNPVKGFVVAYHRDRGEAWSSVAPRKELCEIGAYLYAKGMNYFYFWSKEKGWRCFSHKRVECIIPK